MLNSLHLVTYYLLPFTLHPLPFTLHPASHRYSPTPTYPPTHPPTLPIHPPTPLSPIRAILIAEFLKGYHHETAHLADAAWPVLHFELDDGWLSAREGCRRDGHP